jgi:hypothetical protein
MPASGQVVVRATAMMKRAFGFRTLWVAVAAMIPFIILAANVTPALYFIWLPVAIYILVVGMRSTMRMGITVDRDSRTLTVNNWMKTVIIPFADILQLGRSQIHFQSGGLRSAPRNPVYRPAIVQRSGPKVRVDAGSGEPGGGPVHSALADLGQELGIPNHM